MGKKSISQVSYKTAFSSKKTLKDSSKTKNGKSKKTQSKSPITKCQATPKPVLIQANARSSPFKMDVSKGHDWIELHLPIMTVSEANISEHWTKKAKRHKTQKASVRYLLTPHASSLRLPCEIYLTRYAPRKLDRHDNLPISMKYILDAVCEVITGDYRAGRADDSEEINVTYSQVPSSSYGIRIRIEF